MFETTNQMKMAALKVYSLQIWAKLGFGFKHFRICFFPRICKWWEKDAYSSSSDPPWLTRWYSCSLDRGMEYKLQADVEKHGIPAQIDIL